MNNFKLRNAEEKDIAKIGEVYCSCWKSAYKDMLPKEYLDSLTVKNCTPKSIDPVENLLLEDNGKIVGVTNFGKARKNGDKGLAEIRTLYVLEEYCNMGLGEILFNSASLSLMQRGMREVYLWVIEENKNARNFYEKMRMHFSGETKAIDIAGREITLVKYEMRLM